MVVYNIFFWDRYKLAVMMKKRNKIGHFKNVIKYLKLGEGRPLRLSLGVSDGVEENGDDGLWPLVGLVRSQSS